MSAVFSLDGDYAGGHVPALMALGVLRVGDLVREVIPPPAGSIDAASGDIDPFLGLVLGVLSLDARLRALVDPPPEPPTDRGADLGELLR